jgi:hypothetical protein
MAPQHKERPLFTDAALRDLAFGFLQALIADERRYGQGARVMDLEVGYTPRADYTILIVTQPADDTGRRIHRQLRDTANRLLADAHGVRLVLERTSKVPLP